MIKNNSVLVHFFLFFIFIYMYYLLLMFYFFLELGKREVLFLFYQTNRQAHEILVVQMN